MLNRELHDYRMKLLEKRLVNQIETENQRRSCDDADKLQLEIINEKDDCLALLKQQNDSLMKYIIETMSCIREMEEILSETEQNRFGGLALSKVDLKTLHRGKLQYLESLNRTIAKHKS